MLTIYHSSYYNTIFFLFGCIKPSFSAGFSTEADLADYNALSKNKLLHILQQFISG